MASLSLPSEKAEWRDVGCGGMWEIERKLWLVFASPMTATPMGAVALLGGVMVISALSLSRVKTLGPWTGQWRCLGVVGSLETLPWDECSNGLVQWSMEVQRRRCLCLGPC